MKKLLVFIFIVIGLLFLALGIYYAVTPAESLKHFIPGHIAGSHVKHIKHAAACFILAIGFGILAWFSTSKTKLSEIEK
jgi:amino acid permease